MSEQILETFKKLLRKEQEEIIRNCKRSISAVQDAEVEVHQFLFLL